MRHGRTGCLYCREGQVGEYVSLSLGAVVAECKFQYAPMTLVYSNWVRTELRVEAVRDPLTTEKLFPEQSCKINP